VGSFRDLTNWITDGNPMEPLRQMEPQARRELVQQWASWALFVAGLLVISGTAVLAMRPSNVAVEQLVDSPQAIEQIAEAIQDRDDRIDRLCVITSWTPMPGAEQEERLVRLRCPARVVTPP
jgi:hypothetical protein